MRFRLMVLVLLLVLMTCAECLAGATLYTWTGGSGFHSCTLSRASYSKSLGAVVFDAKAPIRTGEDADVAVIETPEIVPPKAFTEAVPSWNTYTPDGAYVMVDIKARVDGKWTGWYRAELYNVSGKPEPRKSFTDSDSVAGIAVDTLRIKGGKTADAIKLRIELRSTDGKNYPQLRLISVNTNDPKAWIDNPEPVKTVWGTELDVPYLCQLSVPGGSVWCSPTSTAMVLDYWSAKLKRPELNVGINDAVAGIRDHRWRGTGNWSFNTAYPAEFKGMRAYVDRFTSVSQIEQWISRGVPVVVSLDYNRLNRRKTTREMGHLMVIRGFTKEGDPVFNDPWARLEKGEKLRKVFKRADLEYAWLGPGGSYGTVYIIHPESLEF